MFGIQRKKNAGSTIAKFQISGMHCSSCSLNIDGELEDQAGVVSASTSYAKSITTVKFDKKKIVPEKLMQTIRGLGYEVEQITA